MIPSSRAIIFPFVLMGKLRLEVEKLLQGIRITNVTWFLLLFGLPFCSQGLMVGR